MSEVRKYGDQSMDDILASIRKIISVEPADALSHGAEQAAEESQVPRPAVEEQPSALRMAPEAPPEPPSEASPEPLSEPPPETGPGTPAEPLPETRIEQPTEVPAAMAGVDGVPQGEEQPASPTVLQLTKSIDAAWPFGGGGREAGGNSLLDTLSSLEARPSEIASRDDAAVASDRDVLGGAGVDAADLLETSTAGGEPSIEGDVEAISASQGVEQGDILAAPAPAPGAAPAERVERSLTGLVFNSVDERAGDVSADGLAAPGMAEWDAVAAGAGAELSVAKPQPEAVAPVETPPVSASGPDHSALEAVVVAALQPMLREWLDANLARLIEERLPSELARRVGDETKR